MHGSVPLAQRRLSWAPVGSTRPGKERWTPPTGFRTHEPTVPVGQGQAGRDLFPPLLVAQRWYRRRYVRALRQPPGRPW